MLAVYDVLTLNFVWNIFMGFKRWITLLFLPLSLFSYNLDYLQTFHGYGDSLINYNVEVSKIGAGFSFSRAVF
ncbi:MAG: hypothetical protein COA44_01065 [Arcobacter sp.]|nr:MAG: hypothetical protein COA44_01065 [Arcobacter sp.]